jgi:hypothetical protein
MTASRIPFIEKWRKTSWADRALLVEALSALAFARLAIALLPFRTVGRLAGGIRVAGPMPQEARLATIRRVRWAIRAGARRAPFRAVCFQQGLAAQLMLRRRRVASTLYFGAAPDDARGLAAHVWVRDGNIDVIGCEEAPRFPVLAQFPGAAAGGKL